MTFLTGLEKKIQEYIWKLKDHEKTKSLQAKNKSSSGGVTVPDFKLYYTIIKTKTAWYCCKNRQAE